MKACATVLISVSMNILVSISTSFSLINLSRTCCAALLMICASAECAACSA